MESPAVPALATSRLSMSLTSRERRNPPGRQKSCAACIKSKRRCDAGFPACARCSQRGIPCELPQRRSPRGGHGAATSTPTPPSTATPDFASIGGTPAPIDSACASLEGSLLSPLDSFWPSIDAATLHEAPDLGSFDEPSLDLIHQPSMVAAPTATQFDPLPETVRRKLSYAVDVIKSVPKMMVLENQTPWCHPKLYEDEMPRSMQDAHACCALYMSKNRVNARIILRTIEARANELMSAPEPPTPSEKLAHTQSLLLYHIIRIFDGDILSRASAERTQSALEDSAMALIAHVNFDIAAQHPRTDLPRHPLAPTKRFWRDWVVQESARRTLLFTFFLLQAYRVLAGHPVPSCDGRLGLCHSFTLSAPLWHASTPVEFSKAWAETRHLVVTNAELESAFKEARAHHVDAFGRILLTSILGVDEAEGWFASRGGSLWSAKESL